MSFVRDAAAALIHDIIKKWHYEQWFSPIPSLSTSDAFDRANSFQEQVGIENHKFFTIAATERGALRLWASQEAIVTGPFSQMLLLT